jgi:hypothetical protein
VAAWLLLRYSFNGNSLRLTAQNGFKTLLHVSSCYSKFPLTHRQTTSVSGCWTAVTAGGYTFLFLHPVWSRYSIASRRVQVMWILLTWLIWIAGTTILNSALRQLIVKGSCFGLMYYRPAQSLFGQSAARYWCHIF